MSAGNVGVCSEVMCNIGAIRVPHTVIIADAWYAGGHLSPWCDCRAAFLHRPCTRQAAIGRTASRFAVPNQLLCCT